MSSCDVRIRQTIENGLEKDSYAVMEQIQPIPRSSVDMIQGTLSLTDWEEILKQMLINFDRA